ncbi:molecular chaperone [Yersinia rochesterensis]|uniref:fimbrial biogenesis chaperone n=1 Tax=Yersinia rochesterensis TaxID=1604335 RepID=UPI00119ED621|nr:molecular chaperone [Yersinia rochesterensis]
MNFPLSSAPSRVIGPLFLLCATLFGTPTYGANVGDKNGITLQSTRVVYPGQAKNGITFTVTNNTAQPYLLQSRVIPWEAERTDTRPAQDAQGTNMAPREVPFIVLPPLQRFEPGEALTLRIRLARNTFPTDRESVFVLSLKAIPGQSSSSESARLVLAMQNNLKLFYRPEGLPEYSAEQLARQLRFQRQGSQLKVSNPTPYYMAFHSLSVGTQIVDMAWVPPFGEQAYPLPVSARGDITWQLIDGMGRVTPTQHRPLTD